MFNYYYFTNAITGAEVGYLYYGSLDDAISYAEKLANELHTDICINNQVTECIDEYVHYIV